MGIWVCMDYHHDLFYCIYGSHLGKGSECKNVSISVYAAMDIECLLESHLLLLQKCCHRVNDYQLVDDTDWLFLSSLLATNKTLFLSGGPLLYMAFNRYVIEWFHLIEELEPTHGFRFSTFD